MSGTWGWVVWAFMLVLQQASHTMVSRARNSGSLGYHAIAAVFSNGVWFGSQVVILSKITEALASKNWMLLSGTAGFYIAFCVLGSVGAHHYLMHHTEKRWGIT